MASSDEGGAERGPSAARRLRVLAVIDGLHLAGAEKLLVGLARRSRSLGIEFGVVSLEAPGSTATVVPELSEAGARVWTVDATRLLDAGAVLRLARLMRSWRCDLVHAHLRYSSTLAPLAARAVRRPVICSLHHVPGSAPARELAKEALAVVGASIADEALAVSRAQAVGFARRYHLREGAWTVLPNGIELGPFIGLNGRGWPSDLGVRVGSGPVVVLVARLRAGKGHALMLDAWHRVLARCPRAHLLLVGDGPLEHHLADLISREGLGASVTLAGARRDVPELLAAADLVALPSDSEALPTVLIEAAAAGTAVVATRVGGVPEVVENGGTGVLVPSNDPGRFADAVAGLLGDAPRRRAMGEGARRRAFERFDADRWAEDLVDVYRRVAARRERGAW